MWVLLLISYFFTPPEMDINYVLGPFEKQQTYMAPGLYLLVCMLVYRLILSVPPHLLLSAYQRRRESRRGAEDTARAADPNPFTPQ